MRVSISASTSAQGWVLALIAFATMSGGCGGYLYRPSARALHNAATLEGDFSVVSLGTTEIAGAIDVAVTVASERVAPRGQLTGATLTVPLAPPCASGWGLSELTVAEAPMWRRPLELAGGQALELTFKDAGGVLGTPSVIDLALLADGQARCVRLNLLTHADADTWTTGPWWTDFRLRSYYPVGTADASAADGHHDGHTGMIRFGRFAGPINFGLAFEGGVGGCAGVCLPRGHYFGFLGAGPSLQGLALERGHLVLTWEAAYDFLNVQELAENDEALSAAERVVQRRLFLHGPRLGLGIFWAVRPRLEGAVRDVRSMYGVELFAAYRRHESVGAGVVGFSFVVGGPIR